MKKISLKSDWWTVLGMVVLGAFLFTLSIGYFYDFEYSSSNKYMVFLSGLTGLSFWFVSFLTILFTIALITNFLEQRSTVLKRETKAGLILFLGIIMALAIIVGRF